MSDQLCVVQLAKSSLNCDHVKRLILLPVLPHQSRFLSVRVASVALSPQFKVFSKVFFSLSKTVCIRLKSSLTSRFDYFDYFDMHHLAKKQNKKHTPYFWQMQFELQYNKCFVSYIAEILLRHPLSCWIRCKNYKLATDAFWLQKSCYY